MDDQPAVDSAPVIVALPTVNHLVMVSRQAAARGGRVRLVIPPGTPGIP